MDDSDELLPDELVLAAIREGAAEPVLISEPAGTEEMPMPVLISELAGSEGTEEEMAEEPTDEKRADEMMDTIAVWLNEELAEIELALSEEAPAEEPEVDRESIGKDEDDEGKYVYDADGNYVGHNAYGNCGFDEEGFYGCDYDDFTGYGDFFDLYGGYGEMCAYNEDGSYGCTIPASYASSYSEYAACHYNEEGDMYCLWPADYGEDWCSYDENGGYSCTFPESYWDWYGETEVCEQNEDGLVQCHWPADYYFGYSGYYSEDPLDWYEDYECDYNDAGSLECVYPASYGWLYEDVDWCEQDDNGNYRCVLPDYYGGYYSSFCDYTDEGLFECCWPDSECIAYDPENNWAIVDDKTDDMEWLDELFDQFGAGLKEEHKRDVKDSVIEIQEGIEGFFGAIEQAVTNLPPPSQEEEDFWTALENVINGEEVFKEHGTDESVEEKHDVSVFNCESHFWDKVIEADGNEEQDFAKLDLNEMQISALKAFCEDVRIGEFEWFSYSYNPGVAFGESASCETTQSVTELQSKMEALTQEYVFWFNMNDWYRKGIPEIRQAVKDDDVLLCLVDLADLGDKLDELTEFDLYA